MTGACLLKIIWSAIERCSNGQYMQLLIYLLRSLCDTYYGQIERWIYDGDLEESINELFIISCKHKMDERSKEFFDSGYHVRSSAVPDFLAGCEKTILQCGKYNRLLKVYSPQHVIFSLKHPELIVCLSDEQLVKMYEKLMLYYTQLEQYIKPFGMHAILESREMRGQIIGHLMPECTEAHIDSWTLQKRDLQLTANILKQQQQDKIKYQLQNQQQLRLEQQRLGIVYELENQQNRDHQEVAILQKYSQMMEKQITDLQTGAQLRNSVSPDESTSSFVSCSEDLDLDTVPEWISHIRQTNVLNSNSNGLDMARNRMRNMSSNQFKESQLIAQLQQSPTSKFFNYSEAERNRLRVLSCTDFFSQLAPDMNMNIENLSDIQCNQKRVRDHNKTVSFYNTDDKCENRLLPSGQPESSCQSMQKELNISLEHKHLLSESPLEIGTPMSTTSDVNDKIDLFKSVIQIETDAVNNNAIFDIRNDDPFKPVQSVGDVYKPKEINKSVVGLFSLQLNTSHTDMPRQSKEKFKHNPFMIKRYMQLSIMIPLNAHLSLLRNEVLRVFCDLRIDEYFRQLRNYFFLMDGEFGTLLVGGILEKIEAGMAACSLCQKGVLDAILNNALINKAVGGESAGATVTLADNLTLNCTNIPNEFDLMNIDVLSMLTLNCKVKWPLNLVISVETLAKYEQVFSNLLKVRHVSYMLERAYQYLLQLGKVHGKAIRTAPQYRYLQIVRHKLSQFVITFQNHLETNALQASWKSFTDDLLVIGSVEELYQRHVDYLKQIAFLSFLNRQSVKFRNTIDNILTIVLRFCKILHSQAFVLNAEDQFVHPRYKRLEYEEGEFEKFMRYIVYLGNKIADFGYQEQMVGFIRIINFNDYYNISGFTN